MASATITEPKLPSEPALIVLSGGMDSGVILALLQSQNIQTSAISFFYGSKHGKRELESASSLAKHYQVEHQSINIESISSALKSSLLKNGEQIPLGSYDETNMASTIVPFRNGIFASIAAGVAESTGKRNIYLGTHGGDHRVYPDCRPEFNRAIAEAIAFGSDSKVKFHAPFEILNKAQIASLGLELSFPFEKSWTCYQGGELHCGKCAACIERRAALGDNDPTNYETDRQLLGNL